MRRLLLALLLLGPLLACGGDDTDPLADEAGSFLDDLEDELDDGPLVESSGDEITLLDPGAEPRQVLRLSPPEDCEQRLTLRQELTQDVSAAGEEEHQSQESSYDMTYRCTAVSEDRIEVTATWGSVQLDTGTELPDLDDFVDALSGAEMHLVLDPRGAILESALPDLDLDGTFGQVMDQMFEGMGDAAQQSFAPFPEEAVGIGARWRVAGTTNALGMGMRTTTEYTVTELTADRVAADVQVSLTFAEGAVDFPGLPPGADLEVLDSRSTGNGTTVWDLHGVMPIQSQVTDGTVRMRVTIDGETVESEIVQHQEMEWTER